MFVFYEETILNYILMTLAHPFCSLSNDKIAGFKDFQALKQEDVENTKEEDIFILLTTRYTMEALETILPNRLKQIVVLMKDEPEDQTEQYRLVNWYIYWNRVEAAHPSFKELLTELFIPADRLPDLVQRNIIEYFSGQMCKGREEFKIHLHESKNKIFSMGKKMIAIKQPIISEDIKNSYWSRWRVSQ